MRSASSRVRWAACWGLAHSGQDGLVWDSRISRTSTERGMAALRSLTRSKSTCASTTLVMSSPVRWSVTSTSWPSANRAAIWSRVT